MTDPSNSAAAGAASAAKASATAPVARGWARERPPPKATDGDNLPRSVFVIAVLLIVQGATRFGLLAYALVMNDLARFLGVTINLIQIVLVPAILATAAVSAGILILQRSRIAASFGLAAAAVCLLAQIYTFSIAVSVYLTGRVSDALFTFTLWVLQPLYLGLFAVVLIVLARWRPIRD